MLLCHNKCTYSSSSSSSSNRKVSRNKQRDVDCHSRRDEKKRDTNVGDMVKVLKDATLGVHPKSLSFSHLCGCGIQRT